MGKRLVDRIPFAKILIALAIVFILSLGLCGASLVMTMRGMPASTGQLMDKAAGWDLVVMVLSVLGLVVTGIAWVVAAVVSGSVREVSQPKNPYAVKDDTTLEKKE